MYIIRWEFGMMELGPELKSSGHIALSVPNVDFNVFINVVNLMSNQIGEVKLGLCRSPL